jgi:hypothetical protein
VAVCVEAMPVAMSLEPVALAMSLEAVALAPPLEAAPPNVVPLGAAASANAVTAATAPAARIRGRGRHQDETSHRDDGNHPLHRLLPSVPGQDAPRARYPK